VTLREKFGEVMCTNDSKTLRVLEDFANAFTALEDEGHKVEEVCMPPSEYEHLANTTNLLKPSDLSPELLYAPSSIFGARVKFSHKVELRSGFFDTLQQKHPAKKVRNGFLVMTEPVKDLPEADRFQIKVRLMHPVFDSSSVFGGLHIIVKHRSAPIAGVSREEWRAIDTLREMITEKDYRRYVKDGFLLVKAPSGKIYQIFRTRAHTNVWVDGEKVEEVCIRIPDDKAPPTDSVIAIKVMLETDEEALRSMANVYPMRKAA
jgi:hypothetical protein